MSTTVFKSDERVTYASALFVRNHNFYNMSCEVYQMSELKDTDLYNNASYLATLHNQNRRVYSKRDKKQLALSVRYITVAAVKLGDSEYVFSMSVHNPVDKYDKHEGRKVALARLNRSFLGRPTEDNFVWSADFSTTETTSKIKIYPFFPNTRMEYPKYEEVLDLCDLRFGTPDRPDFRALAKEAYKIISNKISQDNPRFDITDYHKLK